MPVISISSSPTFLLIFFSGKLTSWLSDKSNWYWIGHRVPDGRSISLQLHTKAVQNTVPQFIWAQEGKEQVICHLNDCTHWQGLPQHLRWFHSGGIYMHTLFSLQIHFHSIPSSYFTITHHKPATETSYNFYQFNEKIIGFCCPVETRT